MGRNADKISELAAPQLIITSIFINNVCGRLYNVLTSQFITTNHNNDSAAPITTAQATPFAVRCRRTRNTQTGELNPAEQVITFGKRITNELYLGYEYSVTSANQAVKLIWQINSTLQAISRVGTDSVSGEVRYTIRFD